MRSLDVKRMFALWTIPQGASDLARTTHRSTLIRTSETDPAGFKISASDFKKLSGNFRRRQILEAADFTKPAGQVVSRPRPDGLQSYLTFLPTPLPPPAQVERDAVASFPQLYGDAEYWLGHLIGIGVALPNPDLLVRPYMRQEAVQSSQIEGTQTSFSDLVAYEVEAEAPPGSDVRDVHNYLLAMEQGLRSVHLTGVTADVVRRLHRTLMTGARGEGLSQPGEFRTVQNHVGGAGTNDPADAKYVPPPPLEMQEALDAFFTYVAATDEMSPLVKVAWSHYQFETIHPFQDGNGRVGRILIPLLLAQTRGLEHPLLYLSPYFHRHRHEYYNRLFAVSAESDWAGWLRFFLEAVVQQAKIAVATSQKVIGLGGQWSERLEKYGASPTAQRLAQLVHQQYLAINARVAHRALQQSGASVQLPTVYAAIHTLEEAGILNEATGRTYRKVWIARELLVLLEPEGGSIPAPR